MTISPKKFLDSFLDKSVESCAPGSREEEAQEDAKTEARERRLEFCGTKASRIDPLSGQWYAYTMYCGHWRDCETCKLRRAQKFKNRFARAAEQAKDKVFLEIVSTKGEANTICRRLRRADVLYWRVPVDANGNDLCDEIYIMFDAKVDMGLGIRISGLDLEWDLLASTPLGMRSSGKLGVVVKEEEKEEEAIQITVPDWNISTPDHTPLEKLHAEVQKIVELEDLKFTKESLRMRVDALEQAMIKVVKSHGGEIEKRSAQKSVTISAYTSYIERQKANAERKARAIEASRPAEITQLSLEDLATIPF